MAFDAAAVRALFAQLESHAQTLGLFQKVNGHEPKNAPGNGMSCAIWISDIEPLAAASGLAATSGRVGFTARVYLGADQEPLSGVDPEVTGAACQLMAAYSGDFDLGGLVRDVDLLGQHGAALSARAAYLEQDGRFFRVMEVTLPLIINDLWPQEA